MVYSNSVDSPVKILIEDTPQTIKSTLFDLYVSNHIHIILFDRLDEFISSLINVPGENTLSSFRVTSFPSLCCEYTTLVKPFSDNFCIYLSN